MKIKLAKYTSIGGQALIEGIMMKHPQKKTALAVRKADKTIDISYINDKSIKDKYDYILIDCPPNLGVITRNGLKISDVYIINTCTVTNMSDRKSRQIYR